MKKQKLRLSPSQLLDLARYFKYLHVPEFTYIKKYNKEVSGLWFVIKGGVCIEVPKSEDFEEQKQELESLLKWKREVFDPKVDKMKKDYKEL